MNSEIFHLVFNNFKTNISTNWSELREESQFCDVTLACEGSRVEAHKVILSSCSPVIKDLLIQTNHPHPLVYLRGVKSMQIKALLDFIYRGEVNIAREDLDDFLEVARELKVKGLAEDDKKGEELSANTSKSFGNNEDKFTPAKVKSAVPTPTVYSSIVKEEYVFKNQNQKTYCETHEESNFEPHIKMEEYTVGVGTALFTFAGVNLSSLLPNDLLVLAESSSPFLLSSARPFTLSSLATSRKSSRSSLAISTSPL